MRGARERSPSAVAVGVITVAAAAVIIAAVPAAIAVWAETADLARSGAEPAVALAFSVVAFLPVADLQVRGAAVATAALWVAGTFLPGFALAHQAGLAWMFIAAAGAVSGIGSVVATAVLAAALGSGVLPGQVQVAVFAGIAVWAAVRPRPRGPSRLAIGSVAGATLVALVLAAAWAARERTGGIGAHSVLLAYSAALILVAVLIAATAASDRRRIVRLRENAASAGEATGLAGIEPVLRAALHDDGLRLRLPSSPSGADTAASSRAQAGDRETTDILDDSGAVIVTLEHRVGVLRDARLAAAVIEAVRLANDHDRLQAELDGQRRAVARARADLFERAHAGRMEVAGRVDHDVLVPLRQGVRLLDGARPAPRHPAVDGTASDADPLDVAVAEVQLAERDLLGVIDAAWARDLGDGRLATELRALARGGVPTVAVNAEDAATADDPTETALYFIASEALSNAMKHARASRIEIRATHDGDRIRLEVLDDGSGGVDPSGLPAIRRRVTALAGRLAIESRPGEGTRITVEVPRRRSGPTAR
ncbi:sensor histidine kinase [Agromyces sp. M3QZ16-3]|uniref:sensor histidine kinase n=1 Tax=Agromyces sp. M3QZ16-3 TaxID=3447585 RepID=UPI003F693719